MLLLAILVLFIRQTDPCMSVTKVQEPIVRSEHVAQADLPQDFHNLTNQGAPIEGKLVVDVYYEVLCPDSRAFLLYQLTPAWIHLENIFTVNFIPYGKAQTYGEGSSLSFSCQHGPVECEGNIWHACAIKYIDNVDSRLNFLNCMINNNYNPYKAALRCSRRNTVDWANISNCAKGDEGKLLLSLAGERTHALRPWASFIPTIEVDGRQHQQWKLRDYFSDQLCKIYQGGMRPEHCKSL